MYIFLVWQRERSTEIVFEIENKTVEIGLFICWSLHKITFVYVN